MKIPSNIYACYTINEFLHNCKYKTALKFRNNDPEKNTAQIA